MIRNIKLLVAFLLLFAQDVSAKNSGLVLYNDRGKKFKVYANGVLQNNNFLSEVKICCFPDVIVKVRVEFESNKSIEDTIYLSPGHFEYDYVSETKIEFDHYSKLHHHYDNDSTPRLIMPEIGTQTGIKKNTCDNPISNTSFYDFFRHMVNMNGPEDEKLEYAKYAISTACFTAKQVSVTLEGFANESTRLKFAKFAYGRVVNKSDYGTLITAFTHQHSKFEFERFLESKQVN